MKIDFTQNRISPIKFKLFLLIKLPLAFLAGLKLMHLSDDQCMVQIHHRWINQNPFRSMYFRAMLMVAEMSTGLLVVREIQKSGLSFSMLVLEVNSSYYKKARGTIEFICKHGDLCQSKLKECIETKEPICFKMKSEATDESNDVVSETEIVWTVKTKQKI